ncbi:hypothetical protein [Erythrobacter alti]|uniref:hypothetical protein n=1 Tax=Erythrobacter alti TaxID=1896145 RepID=UPI0030F39A63
MATLPMDQAGHNSGGGKPPVSAHRLFPAIVGLWFAALLGLGSLIAPMHVIERLVGMTGLANMLPAAQAPLGGTAVAIVALVAAIFGGLAGFAIARRIQARILESAMADDDPYDDADTLDLVVAETADDVQDEPVETIEATEDDADDRPRRRRPLTLAENAPESDLLLVVPLPGDSDQDAAFDEYAEVEVLDASEIEAPVEFENEQEDEAGYEHSGEDAFAEDEIDEVDPFPGALDDYFDGEPDDAPEDDAAAEILAPIAITQEDMVPPVQDDEAAPPLAFSPPSLARTGDEPVEDGQEPVETNDEWPEAEAASVPDSSDVEDVPLEPVSTSTSDDLAEMGLVQLVQRLEKVLDEHRAWSAARAAEREAGTPAEQPVAREVAPSFTPAPPDEAACAMAEYFGRAQGTPAAVTYNEQPESVVEPENTADAEIAEPADAPDPVEGTAISERDASYRALSSIDNPFRPQAGTVQHARAQQVSHTNAQKAPAVADNDVALRDAVLNLHRMLD